MKTKNKILVTYNKIKKFMKIVKSSFLVILSLTLITAASSTSCHTISGVGQDVEKAGEKIEKTSDRTRRNMAN